MPQHGGNVSFGSQADKSEKVAASRLRPEADEVGLWPARSEAIHRPPPIRLIDDQSSSSHACLVKRDHIGLILQRLLRGRTGIDPSNIAHEVIEVADLHT